MFPFLGALTTVSPVSVFNDPFCPLLLITEKLFARPLPHLHHAPRRSTPDNIMFAFLSPCPTSACAPSSFPNPSFRLRSVMHSPADVLVLLKSSPGVSLSSSGGPWSSLNSYSPPPLRLLLLSSLQRSASGQNSIRHPRHDRHLYGRKEKVILRCKTAKQTTEEEKAVKGEMSRPSCLAFSPRTFSALVKHRAPSRRPSAPSEPFAYIRGPPHPSRICHPPRRNVLRA